ncbi:MAG: 2,3-bisphosphoglycerate-independent phosphoglycerate mutase [Candidatus Komeilibacteria bacterium]
MESTPRPKPLVLIILDGWGIAPPSRANAISLAKTPNLDAYMNKYPTMSLQAGGESVGLAWGEMGNSEVGHLSIGSGRILYQSLPRITRAIFDKSFFANPAFLAACEHVKKNKSKLHLLGLVSSGGVHSFNEHLYALLELAAEQKIDQVYIHAFLDGRDTPYNSGSNFMAKLKDKIKQIGVGQIATLVGRFYAMDRDNHWERIVEAYKALVNGEAKNYATDAVQAIEASYSKQIYDEQLEPTVITNEAKQPLAKIQDGDAIICFNFRADRMREITKALILPGFDKFPREYMRNLFYVSMTEYEKDLPLQIAFAPEKVQTPVAKVISDAGLKQLHIAETEKYAHVTYFFNGGQEKMYPDEDHVLIPSLKVASYDQKPAMSTREITNRVIQEIREVKYDFIVANFANPDMVAHTGNLQATIEACEIADDCIGKIVDVVLSYDGAIIITADHGNAEALFNLQTGEIDKEHSNTPVPCIFVGRQWEGKNVAGGVTGTDLSSMISSGVLSDVGLTIIKILGLKKPPEMTGTSLI